MREGEKVEGIPLDSFIGYGMGNRQRFGKATAGRRRGTTVQGQIEQLLGSGEGSAEGGGNDLWVWSLRSLR